MANHSRGRARTCLPLVLCALAAVAVALAGAGAAQAAGPKGPTFIDQAASDVSKPLSELAKGRKASQRTLPARSGRDTDREFFVEKGAAGLTFTAKAGIFSTLSTQATAAIPAPLLTFEGLSNTDNFNLFGFRVNPPDPVGDVGPNHYVEMVNLAFAVYDKAGNKLLGPVDTGTLWSGFPIEDCTDPSGDPIVLYDQFADRWLLTQFSTRGTPYYYDCVAISQTGDPTGAYYRYAFVTQEDVPGSGLYYFPDYPKYGVWKDSYVMTTRDFGDNGGYGISVYAFDKNKMVNGQPARAVQFFLDSAEVPLELIGDGLLPADVDGKTKPKQDVPIPIVGTQDDNHPYGAPFDALNIYELDVHWNSRPDASFKLAAQLPVAAFDSVFPCGVVPGSQPASSRDCLPQPGVADGSRFLDILSYRQRPTHRLAHRSFKDYETMVTTQSVEALPGVAGMRWYEIRRVNGAYSLHQQGTYAPADGVHRWMGSVAMDKKGNMALGYSVVNGTTVYPGIRYTGRLAGDPPGQMPLGEGVIVNGSGVQTTLNSRWGDYTSLNVDPVDDCTFWYVNEYYTAASQATSAAGWLTRIGAFKLPGC